jgi:hypothetical protein
MADDAQACIDVLADKDGKAIDVNNDETMLSRNNVFMCWRVCVCVCVCLCCGIYIYDDKNRKQNNKTIIIKDKRTSVEIMNSCVDEEVRNRSRKVNENRNIKCMRIDRLIYSHNRLLLQ